MPARQQQDVKASAADILASFDSDELSGVGGDDSPSPIQLAEIRARQVQIMQDVTEDTRAEEVLTARPPAADATKTPAVADENASAAADQAAATLPAEVATSSDVAPVAAANEATQADSSAGTLAEMPASTSPAFVTIVAPDETPAAAPVTSSLRASQCSERSDFVYDDEPAELEPPAEQSLLRLHVIGAFTAPEELRAWIADAPDDVALDVIRSVRASLGLTPPRADSAASPRRRAPAAPSRRTREG